MLRNVVFAPANDERNLMATFSVRLLPELDEEDWATSTSHRLPESVTAVPMIAGPIHCNAEESHSDNWFDALENER
jgi:hypothetical protein